MKLAIICVAVLAVSGINSLPLSGKSLEDDFADFAKIIPVKKIQDLVLDYAIADPDFGAVVDYIYSAEFKEQLQSVEEAGEFKDLLDYLVASGLDAYGFVNMINAELKLDPIAPLFRARSSRMTGGLSGLLKDIKALLPLDEIKKLYEEKYVSSPEFTKLVDRLNCQEFFKTVGTLLENSVVQNFISKAEKRGVDFDAILDFLETLLGFEIPRPVVLASKTVREHLKDLLALVPVEDLMDLAADYAASDPDFGEAYDYIMDEEFSNIVTNIESTAELKNILNFLEELGVPAYEYVNKFNDLLGIEQIKPILRRLSQRITGGLPGFLQDAKDLLPQEEIKKLFEEKLAKYPEFKAFYDGLKSDEFEVIVLAILENDDVKTLIGQAQSKGVDFQAILDFISAMFGFEFPVGL